MECTYLPTGQKILFFGTDDPGKLKSIKVPFGAIGLAWFEELDQFDGPEEVRSVEQSVFRGGNFTLAFKSFNPPASGRNWANRYVLEQRPGKLVHHSTYRDLPPAWLGERFFGGCRPPGNRPTPRRSAMNIWAKRSAAARQCLATSSCKPDNRTMPEL